MTARQRSGPQAGEDWLPDLVAGLIVDVARGDRAAFAELYRSQFCVLRAVALQLLRDLCHAEEVAQEAMLAIWVAASRFDPALGSGQHWMWQLARSKAIDRIRGVQASRNRDTGHGTAQYVPAFDVVAETAMQREEVTELHAAWQLLSAVQREALWWAFFTELSHPQIAERLSIPLGTVKTRIRDGLLHLRRSLDPSLEREHPAA